MLNNLDALEETLKILTINNAGNYESEKTDAKGDPTCYPNLGTHTSDGKKRRVTDTSNRNLQQNLLSHRALPIITTTTDPRISYRVASCGDTPHAITMTTTKGFITNVVYRGAHILWTPIHISRTGRSGTTPRNGEILLRSLRDNGPVLIEGIVVPPTMGNSGGQEIFNKRRSTSSSITRNAQTFDASVDINLADDRYSMEIFSKVLGSKLSNSLSADIYFSCLVDFTSNAVGTKVPYFMYLKLLVVNTFKENDSLGYPTTRVR